MDMTRYRAAPFAASLLLLAFNAGAEPLAVSAWQQAAAAKPTGDPVAGEKLYTEQGCPGCHGAAGLPDNRDWPVLQGQRPLYTYKMLLDYRAGRVGGPDAALMAPMAAGLSDQAMADLAAWLAERPRPPARRHSADPAILRGDRARLIPPCEACHGANGQGWDAQPALGGQNAGYFAAALRRFKSGERGNDLNAGMAMIAKRLSEEEIRALTDHYGR